MTRATHPIRPAHTTLPSGGPDACAELVRLARREAVPGMEPRAYLRRLGHAGAGIRPGLPGLYDLARAGDNRLPGGGFRPPLDDGTRGQARHLLGIAACVERFGARPTWWVSVHIRRDRPTSPDGRLTDIGIAFASRHSFIRPRHRPENAVASARRHRRWRSRRQVAIPNSRFRCGYRRRVRELRACLHRQPLIRKHGGRDRRGAQRSAPGPLPCHTTSREATPPRA
mgnify:CR=1 FL=1